jgi:hypothetical protein
VRRLASLILAAAALAACGPVATGGPGCSPTLAGVRLPDELSESSGVAVSLDHPGVFWTHNDHGDMLYAVDRNGAIVGRFHLDRSLRDWEDLAIAQCPDGGSCLYLEDMGDNYEERHDIHLLRVREPDPSTGGGELKPDVFPVKLPDGPRDTEALLVLPGERVFAVTKGRNDPVTLYRYPGHLRPDTVTLEEVQRLSEGPRILPRQVTGGSVSPDGKVIAVRTYEAIHFYRMDADTLVPLAHGVVNLRPLHEAQGEGVGIGLDGLVALTSEGGPTGGPAGLALLHCRLPGP